LSANHKTLKMFVQLFFAGLICGSLANVQNDNWRKISQEKQNEEHLVRISTEKDGDICSGALVESNKVLTSFECIKDVQQGDLRVRLGGKRQDQCQVMRQETFDESHQGQPRQHGHDDQDTLVILTLNKDVQNAENKRIRMQETQVQDGEQIQIEALGLENDRNQQTSQQEFQEQEQMRIRKADAQVTQVQSNRFQTNPKVSQDVEDGALAICKQSNKLCALKMQDERWMDLTRGDIKEFLKKNL